MKVDSLELEEIRERLSHLVQGHKVALLVDDHSFDHCYAPIAVEGVQILSVPNGEECKDIEIVAPLWLSLSEAQMTRDDYLVTLGGGALSDLGGFVASTYQRGMRLIHIPTTLLGMIDASIGGKTAINFNTLKNSIGTFYDAEEVWLGMDFLQTLPAEELQSGWGEMLKYGLLLGEETLKEILACEELTTETVMQQSHLVQQAIGYKLEVTARDHEDRGERMVLNLGHTAGHALEAYLRERGTAVPHGVAVAAGIVIALYLSYRYAGLPEACLTCVARYVRDTFPRLPFSCKSYPTLWHLALGDKKRSGTKEALRMVWLQAIGEPIIKEGVTKEQLQEALDFYQDFM